MNRPRRLLPAALTLAATLRAGGGLLGAPPPAVVRGPEPLALVRAELDRYRDRPRVLAILSPT